MKKLALIIVLLSFFNSSYAQKIKELDTSPLDLAVFRPNGQGTHPVARIIYSRPQKKEREVFGSLVPYGKIWRVGANQSTELNLYQDIIIEGKKLKAGNYTMYTIPNKNSWKIIFNSNLFTWGTYDYDSSKNILEFEVPIKHSEKTIEAFGIAFSGKNNSGKLLLAWDNIEVYINFNY